MQLRNGSHTVYTARESRICARNHVKQTATRNVATLENSRNREITMLGANYCGVESKFVERLPISTAFCLSLRMERGRRIRPAAQLSANFATEHAINKQAVNEKRPVVARQQRA
jgi:hypothetical protein